jgi:single-strand DNA-binding protein
MSQGGYVTLVGYVAQDPIIRKTKQGTNVTDVRVGTTPRFLDRKTGEWRDGDTSYYTVTCWRRLADHTKASLHKGDPVVVKGRFRTSSYEDKTGQLRTSIEIEADAIGHDLSRGISNYFRTRTAADSADGPADGGTRTDDSARTNGNSGTNGNAGADGNPGGYSGTQHDGSAEHDPAEDFIDDEAIKRLERELGAGLHGDQFPAQALDEDDDVDEDEEEGDEHEAIGTPGTPRTPEASMPI